MTHVLLPLELMTAGERAGFRIACERFRQYGARMEMSGRAIGGTEAPPSGGQLLTHAGRMIQMVANLTEDTLKYAQSGQAELPPPAL